MKYLEALKKKNLSVDNLSKTLQKKIQELNYQILALEDVENIPEEDLQKSDLEDIKQIKKNLQELDSYIEHKVNIFDQVKYQEKLEKVNKMTEAKKQIKEGGEVKEVKQPKIEEPVVTKVVAVEPTMVQSNQIGNTTPIEDTYIPTPEVVQEVVQPLYEQHEEEFEKVSDTKPKSMTTGLILMGVGAFFLTWGAVNFFKSKR
jgi:predicted RNA-binding protein with EMAP domain